jgi:hypothetical protein
MRDNLSSDTIIRSNRIAFGVTWRPTRVLETAPPTVVTDQIAKTVLNATQQTITAPTATGNKPVQLLQIVATESPSVQNGKIYSLVSVSFIRNTHDTSYAGTRIWISGYQGNQSPVLITQTSDSPTSFLLESTKESIQVIGQPYTQAGISDDLSVAASTLVVLDGIVSAPPAPGIAQITTATSSGWQFAFNPLTGIVADLIDGYWIYRNTTNTAGTAVRYKYVKHSATSGGVYTFQEVTTTSPVYYWVTAVNTSGLESTQTSAAAGGSTSSSIRPTANAVLTIGFSNPQLAYDNSQATYATGSATNGQTKAHEWSAFPAVTGTPTAITLRTLASGTVKSLTGHITTATYVDFSLKYSLNNGSTYTNITSASVSLPSNQNMTLVKVKSTLISTTGIVNGEPASTSITVNINDIWAEVTV